MKVFVAVPPVAELYPWSAVCIGLRQLGHEILPATQPFDGDFLVTWSPWKRSRREAITKHYEQQRKPVIVMENGWLSPIKGEFYYQVALDGWNGTGRFRQGSSSRWESWGITTQPWTTRTLENCRGFALVIGQRGHPFDDRTSPPNWHKNVILPGTAPILSRDRDSNCPLSQQIDGAAEVHVWTSGAASHAIIAGVPVVCHGPNHILRGVMSAPGQPLYRGGRIEVLERAAWAQWSIEELMTGVPFGRLLYGAIA